MKKIFTEQEFRDSAGFWIKNKPDALNNLIKTISINGLIKFEDVLNSSLVPIQDKRWWIYNSLDLNLNEKICLSLKSAYNVLPLYENKYPTDKRVRVCLNITSRFLKRQVNLKVLIKHKNFTDAVYATNAVYAAANAADAVYAAANAVYAAAIYAATYDAATNAADAAIYAAAAAIYAADAATYDAAIYAADAAIYAADAVYATNAVYAANAADAAIYAANAAAAANAALFKCWIKYLKSIC